MRKALRFMGQGRPKSLFVAAREDLAAFEHVYDEYANQVLAYLARRTLDPEVAFDLMAETFAEVFDHIDGFRGSSDEEGRAWLYKIATHQLIRWRKLGALERRKLTEIGIARPDLGQEDFERIEALVDFQQLKPRLGLAMRRLSEDQRQIIQLRVIEERSYDEIAALLGCSNNAIRHHVSRALRQLAVTLEGLGTLNEETAPAPKELMT